MIRQTQALIRGATEDTLLNYRVMTDTRKLMAMKILVQLQVIVHVVRPSLTPPMVMKIVQLTMLIDISTSGASTGFCYFGCYLGHLGLFHVGHTFAQLGKSLATKCWGAQEMGAVLLVLAKIKCFVEPVHAALEASCGDTYWASMNRLQYITNLFWCAPQLSTVKRALTEAREFLEHRDPARLRFILANQQSLNKLLGYNDDIGNEESSIISQSAMKNVRIGALL